MLKRSFLYESLPVFRQLLQLWKYMVSKYGCFADNVEKRVMNILIGAINVKVVRADGKALFFHPVNAHK